jgi:signal transduction histidine kinase
MFNSAVLRLTAWYVAALVLVCMLFSIPIYNITSNRLAEGANRQAQVIERLPNVGPRFREAAPQLREEREQQLARDRSQLLRTLLLANLIIITAGAYLSYVFAKYTLRPLEEAHEAQSRFTADASHELRTPLANMQSEIEVALRTKKLTASQANAVLASNLEEIKRLNTLSDQLLKLTRLGSNGLELIKLKLDNVVNEELSICEKQFGIKIAAHIEKNISVNGDQQLLKQVVNILISNSVKYAGNNNPVIEVQLRALNNYAELTVHDQGTGIAPGDIPHIFDRFYRGRNSVSESGHGLGLSLAKEIVDKHHGTIRANSTSTGTSLTITLPSLT